MNFLRTRSVFARLRSFGERSLNHILHGGLGLRVLFPLI